MQKHLIRQQFHLRLLPYYLWREVVISAEMRTLGMVGLDISRIDNKQEQHAAHLASSSSQPYDIERKLIEQSSRTKALF